VDTLQDGRSALGRVELTVHRSARSVTHATPCQNMRKFTTGSAHGARHTRVRARRWALTKSYFSAHSLRLFGRRLTPCDMDSGRCAVSPEASSTQYREPLSRTTVSRTTGSKQRQHRLDRAPAPDQSCTHPHTSPHKKGGLPPGWAGSRTL
jgi:hypothetical protein